MTVIYIGHARAQERIELNYIELVNEFFVQEASVHLIFFTDFITDASVQYQYGWYMIAGITFVFVFNFSFIFREVIKIIGLFINRYYNRISKYTDKLFSTEK